MPCICPLDGSTCWTCEPPPAACQQTADTIEEIKTQAFVQAGIDIGFCYSADEAIARVLTAARQQGRELATLEKPQSVDAVDPHVQITTG